MKFLDYIRKKTGTKSMTEEGISASEKFQRIFFQATEGFIKNPPNIKEIFLSNISRRVFSYPMHSTIDNRVISFFKEKISGSVQKYTVSNTSDTVVTLNPDLVKRSEKIGIEIANESTTSRCNVHIRPKVVPITCMNEDDLFFFVVEPNTISRFQFDIAFSTCKLILRQQSGSGDVSFVINFLPL